MQSIQLSLNDLPLALLTVGADHIIKSCNERVQEVFGYTPEELVGQNVEVLVPVPSRERHNTMMDEYFRNPEPRQLGVGRHLTAVKKDGSIIPVEISLQPIVGSETLILVSTFCNAAEINKRIAERLSEVIEVQKRSVAHDAGAFGQNG